MIKTIDIIGCGNVGKTLARLWTERNVLEVQAILNRSLASGKEAVEFVGGGRAIESYSQILPADIVMISTSDESIEACCRQLCETNVLQRGVVVFHCSGSLPSTLLEPARDRGARIAGVHPVKSFADPATAAKTFDGTFCAIEGDPEACDVLRDVLERCGAIPFSVQVEFKTIYHAATVMVCNYLVALLEVGLRCFEKAGVTRETAVELMRPIVAETVENVFKLGPVRALTGPIARGETSVVARQSEALARWDQSAERIYKTLGQIAVELSAAQGHADPNALATIAKILQAEEPVDGISRSKT